MNDTYDAIIIGAGMAGVASAIHLLKKGQRVLLLDKIGIARETSYGNSGIIESSYVLPFAPPHWKNIPSILLGYNPYARISYPDGISQFPWMLNFYLKSQRKPRTQNGAAMRPLVENAIAEHEAIMNPAGAAHHISDHGRIKLHRTAQSFENSTYERQIIARNNVPFEILSVDQLRELEPDLKPNFQSAIRLSGSKRYTNPAKAIQCAADWFIGQGGHYKTVSVSSLEKRQGQWHVGTYCAKHVVICTGPWANEILKPLGHTFPLGVKRGYHQHFNSPAKIMHTLVDADEGYLICPMDQGIRITTGAEFAQLDTEPNPIQIAQALPKVKELIDIGDPAEQGAWMGTRPCMADSLPVIGQSGKHEGLWFNFGHGHCGITAGPSSARLLSEMVIGGATFCPPEPYSPKRFRQ